MKEELRSLWQLVRAGKWRALLLSPTESTLLQFLRYLIVGGVSFITDALMLRLCERVFGLHYLCSAAVGFLFGVTVNYILSGLLAFAGQKARVGKTAELFIFLIISVLGLAWTELLMWLFTEKAGFHYMLSKVIAAALVLLWNYFAKRLLYRKKEA